MALYRGSPEFVADNNGQPYHPQRKVTNRVDKISNMIEVHARSAFAQGLTMASAVQVGIQAGQAARASYAEQPSNGPAAQAQAKAQAGATITAALATGTEPTGGARLPMPEGALLQTSVWDSFVASAGPLEPGHVEIHDALCSCLAELTAEHGLA